MTDDEVEPPKSSAKAEETAETAPLKTSEQPAISPIDLSATHPRCPKCGKAGQFLPPHRIDAARRVLHADFRCSSNHTWIKAFSLS